MSLRTTVSGVFAVVVAVIMVIGCMIPIISNLEIGGNDGGSGYTNVGEPIFANVGDTKKINISSNFNESYMASFSIIKDDDVIYQIEKDVSNISDELDYDTLYNSYIAFGEKWSLSVFCSYSKVDNAVFCEYYLDCTRDFNDNLPDMPYGELNVGESYNSELLVGVDLVISSEDESNIILPNVIGVVPKSGENDWVLCENPVISADTLILPFYSEDGFIWGIGIWEDVDLFDSAESTLTYSSSPYNDLIKVNMIEERYIGLDSQEYIVDISDFIVPVKIAGDGNEQDVPVTLGGALGILISVIPMIVLIGIILGAITLWKNKL